MTAVTVAMEAIATATAIVTTVIEFRHNDGIA